MAYVCIGGVEKVHMSVGHITSPSSTRSVSITTRVVNDPNKPGNTNNPGPAADKANASQPVSNGDDNSGDNTGNHGHEGGNDNKQTDSSASEPSPAAVGTSNGKPTHGSLGLTCVSEGLPVLAIQPGLSNNPNITLIQP